MRLPDLRDQGLDPRVLIEALELVPHPEGGHFRETWRDRPPGGGRGAGTSILFLLMAGEVSHWHRVDAAEGWHWHAGAALDLSLSRDGRAVTALILGPDLGAAEQPFAMVPPGCWQGARSRGAWTLVGCTVSPAFDFAGFELAPPGWAPAAEAMRDE